jgi:hypothetical protein
MQNVCLATPVQSPIECNLNFGTCSSCLCLQPILTRIFSTCMHVSWRCLLAFKWGVARQSGQPQCRWHEQPCSTQYLVPVSGGWHEEDGVLHVIGALIHFPKQNWDGKDEALIALLSHRSLAPTVWGLGGECTLQRKCPGAPPPEALSLRKNANSFCLLLCNWNYDMCLIGLIRQNTSKLKNGFVGHCLQLS